MSSSTSSGRSTWIVAAFMIASALGASGARAQGTPADSLANLLASPDVHVRALSVASLDALPISALTPGARQALVKLLDAEATHSVTAEVNEISEEDETYEEYITSLTGIVVALNDPTATRALALLGIETSEDAQRLVASAGAANLPVLDDAWQANPSARPEISPGLTITFSVTFGGGVSSGFSTKGLGISRVGA